MITEGPSFWRQHPQMWDPCVILTQSKLRHNACTIRKSNKLRTAKSQTLGQRRIELIVLRLQVCIQSRLNSWQNLKLSKDSCSKSNSSTMERKWVYGTLRAKAIQMINQSQLATMRKQSLMTKSAKVDLCLCVKLLPMLKTSALRYMLSLIWKKVWRDGWILSYSAPSSSSDQRWSSDIPIQRLSFCALSTTNASMVTGFQGELSIAKATHRCRPIFQRWLSVVQTPCMLSSPSMIITIWSNFT